MEKGGKISVNRTRDLNVDDARRGMTLIELVAALVIVAIVSALALVSIGDDNSTAIAEADSLASALRYAQARAMSDVDLWGVLVESDGFTLRKKSNESPHTESNEIMPGDDAKHLFKSPTSVTSGSGTYWFDYRGRPVDPDDGSAISGDQSIVVSGSADVTVTITENTGFIE